MANGFRKTCNKTVRKFFEDFDLLPTEIKRMLQEQPRMPTSEDLQAAWELVEEEGVSGMAKILQNLHVFEERRKAERDNQREAEKLAKQRERANRWNRRIGRNANKIEVLVRVDPRKRMDKHANLVRTVLSEQEAERLMSKRANNDEIVHAGPYWVRKWVEPKEIKEKDVQYLENEPNDSVIKALHNA